MAAKHSRADRERRERERRARAFVAHNAFHQRVVSRLIRDNLLFSVVGGLVILGAFGSQVVLAQTPLSIPVSPTIEQSVVPTDAPTVEP